MSLDFVAVKNKLVAKGGYTISPQTRMLNDLKDLLTDMSNQRGTTGNGRCPSHTVFVTSTPISVGDYDTKATAMKAITCSCQSQTSGCTCNPNACTCVSENNPSSCSCNGDNGSCSCVGVCTCDNDVPGNIDPGCDSYMCPCYSQSSACGCNNYSAGCGCNTYHAACNCNAVSGTCPCNSYFNS